MADPIAAQGFRSVGRVNRHVNREAGGFRLTSPKAICSDEPCSLGFQSQGITRIVFTQSRFQTEIQMNQACANSCRVCLSRLSTAV